MAVTAAALGKTGSFPPFKPSRVLLHSQPHFENYNNMSRSVLASTTRMRLLAPAALLTACM